MNIYVLLSKLIPESTIKDKLRIGLYTYFKNEAIVGYKNKYKLKKGDVVVDAGAFPGEYSLYASKNVGPTGKVICFEPYPENYICLLRVIKNKSNIIAIKKGLWKETTHLHFSGDNQAAGISNDQNDALIEVTSLDEELSRLKIAKVNFIKMDIEGAEIEAIDGMINTLAQDGTNLAIASYHIVNGEQTCILLEKKLKSFGYKVITENKKHLTTYATKGNFD